MFSDFISIMADFAIQTIDFFGYFGIFILMALESCGVPIPSEIIMPFSGFLVNTGRLDFLAVVLLGTLGNLAGSMLAFWIAKKGGRPFVERYGKYILISHHDLDMADRWFTKRGNLTVFFGRLLPVVRTYISFPAGLANMDWRRFAVYTFLGALPWCFLFTWLGMKMGEHWQEIERKLQEFNLLILFLVIASIILYAWRHLRRK
jgi:membrane protein DedA with SNARE-associated domain